MSQLHSEIGLRRALSRFAESGSQRPRTRAPERRNTAEALHGFEGIFWDFSQKTLSISFLGCQCRLLTRSSAIVREFYRLFGPSQPKLNLEPLPLHPCSQVGGKYSLSAAMRLFQLISCLFGLLRKLWALCLLQTVGLLW